MVTVSGGRRDVVGSSVESSIKVARDEDRLERSNIQSGTEKGLAKCVVPGSALPGCQHLGHAIGGSVIGWIFVFCVREGSTTKKGKIEEGSEAGYILYSLR